MYEWKLAVNYTRLDCFSLTTALQLPSLAPTALQQNKGMALLPLWRICWHKPLYVSLSSLGMVLHQVQASETPPGATDSGLKLTIRYLLYTDADPGFPIT